MTTGGQPRVTLRKLDNSGGLGGCTCVLPWTLVTYACGRHRSPQNPQPVGHALAHIATRSLGRETYYVARWRESSGTISWSCQAVTASPEASAFLCRGVELFSELGR